MMVQKKRMRSDSFSTEGEMMRASPPCPPDHIEVPGEVMPHWWAVVCSREYNAWTNPDLEHAANLACCLYDCERLRRELRTESDFATDSEGNVLLRQGVSVINPKHTLLEQLTKRSVTLSRLIHVHAEATSGKARDEVARNKKQREMAEIGTQKNSSLIARPLH